MKKKVISALLAVVMVLTGFVPGRIARVYGADNVVTQEVRVTIGESNYVIDGKSYAMDAVAYISSTSNSTMVPLRFVAQALGVSNDQILWNDVNKTATIITPTNTLQFKIGSSTMVDNSKLVDMKSPDDLPVFAEIRTKWIKSNISSV